MKELWSKFNFTKGQNGDETNTESEKLALFEYLKYIAKNKHAVLATKIYNLNCYFHNLASYNVKYKQVNFNNIHFLVLYCLLKDNILSADGSVFFTDRIYIINVIYRTENFINKIFRSWICNYNKLVAKLIS